METKLKLATNIPQPPKLKPEMMKKIDEESREIVQRFEELTKDMEWLTAEDLKIRIR